MSTTATDFPRITAESLGRAVGIYLERAYPAGGPPEVVRRRIGWMERADAPLDLTAPPFERANRPEPGVPLIVGLRLGNDRYPQMKLQVQPWPNSSGYLLSVNTHDQILTLTPDGPDAEAARALQIHNQGLKEAIELSWDEAGLPTFLRYLRDYLQGASESPLPAETPPDAPLVGLSDRPGGLGDAGVSGQDEAEG